MDTDAVKKTINIAATTTTLAGSLAMVPLILMGSPYLPLLFFPTLMLNVLNFHSVNASQVSTAVRVDSLVDDVFASDRLPADREAALQAINQVLGTTFDSNASDQNTDILKQSIVSAIDKVYESSPDKFSAFMDAIKSLKVGLLDSHPLKMYQSPSQEQADQSLIDTTYHLNQPTKIRQ